jgi:hypothetical protein
MGILQGMRMHASAAMAVFVHTQLRHALDDARLDAAVT